MLLLRGGSPKKGEATVYLQATCKKAQGSYCLQEKVLHLLESSVFSARVYHALKIQSDIFSVINGLFFQAVDSIAHKPDNPLERKETYLMQVTIFPIKSGLK